jgi:Bacterial regulatory proteins, gntR family
MSVLPEPDWLDLPDAVSKALAAFPDADPAAVRRALVKAFHDGKICTKARCRKWFKTGELMELGTEWDPELIQLGWDIFPDEPDMKDRFERTFDDGEKYLFVDIKVQSRGLTRWLQPRQPPPQASHSSAVVAASPERERLTQKKRRGRQPLRTEETAAAMREAIANGQHTKQSLIDVGATEALAAAFGVSRTTIRAALLKLEPEGQKETIRTENSEQETIRNIAR